MKLRYTLKKSQQSEQLIFFFYTTPLCILNYNSIAHMISSHNGGDLW